MPSEITKASSKVIQQVNRNSHRKLSKGHTKIARWHQQSSQASEVMPKSSSGIASHQMSSPGISSACHQICSTVIEWHQMSSRLIRVREKNITKSSEFIYCHQKVMQKGISSHQKVITRHQQS
jgi:hypothetical protein